jgi:hypothetical protein
VVTPFLLRTIVVIDLEMVLVGHLRPSTKHHELPRPQEIRYESFRKLL